MQVTKSETLPIETEIDVVAVRRKVKTWSVDLRFSMLDQTKMLTAASELSRNTLIHGGGGAATLEILDDGGKRGLRIRFVDTGGGIPDVQLAMTDGYTSKNGLGLGLSGSKRLVTDFELQTKVGEGTTVTITRWN